MSAVEYFRYKKQLIPEIMKAYRELEQQYDVIVLEGAGSPAEINLREDDIVNMGMAELADAPVLLAGDIDRGGVFAQLYGTCELLRPEEKARIKGLIVNKFRGDREILEPGLQMLEERVHIPVVGVVPYVYVDVDDEDSLAPRLNRKKTEKVIDIAVIRLPRLSNFTDFSPLESHPALGVRYVKTPEELGQPDLIILPGTKNTMDDLVWLRESGLEALVRKANAAGTPVLGVCGGYQMLGEELKNPNHTEGDLDQLKGMGLLPIRTVFSEQKTRTRCQAEVQAAPFAGARLDGYEIHMGETEVNGSPFCRLSSGQPDGCIRGNVCGTYLHGLFDTGELTERLAQYLAERKGISIADLTPLSHSAYVQKQYDILADTVRGSLDMDAVYRMMGIRE